jgi:hypothetical protein
MYGLCGMIEREMINRNKFLFRKKLKKDNTLEILA